MVVSFLLVNGRGRAGGVDRKTARRYVAAAEEAGLARDGGVAHLTDELLGQVAQAVRPARPGGHGISWRPARRMRDVLAGQHEIGPRPDNGLNVLSRLARMMAAH